MTDPGLIPVPDDLNMGATIRGYVAGQRLFDRYALDKVLGRGGMGVVWLAKDEKLDQQVALKFLPETLRLDGSSLDELKRETRRGLSLAHPHIVRIYDFVDDATAAAISMEYVLRIEQPHRVFETAQLTDWMTQLVEALDYAHRKAKIVHRDLKPANLMTTSGGELKIADFGIARSISDSVSRVSVKSMSSGTLVYMSPQQAQGQSPKASDDIYALGATIYELLTSKPPFHSGNIQHQLDTITPPSMNERRADMEIQGAPIPEAWEKAVAKCLAKDAAERPESVAALGHMLGLHFTATHITSVTSTPAKPKVPLKLPKMPKLPDTKVLVGVGVALVAALMIAGGAYWYVNVHVPAVKAEQALLAQKQLEGAVIAAALEQEKADELAESEREAKSNAEKAALAQQLEEEKKVAEAAEQQAKDAEAAAPNTAAPDVTETQAVAQVQNLIYAKKLGEALYRLQLLTAGMPKERADGIWTLFSSELGGYQQDRDAAIMASRSGDPVAAVAGLKAFDQKNPGDPRIQMAIAEVGERVAPKEDVLNAQIKQFSAMANQDSAMANDPDFQALQNKFVHERDTLVSLTDKMNDMKGGSGNRSGRIAHLKSLRAIAQKKLENYEAGSVATGLFNVFTGSSTSVASSIADKKAEINSYDEQINAIENEPVITQAQIDDATKQYNDFIATVPW